MFCFFLCKNHLNLRKKKLRRWRCISLESHENCLVVKKSTCYSRTLLESHILRLFLAPIVRLQAYSLWYHQNSSYDDQYQFDSMIATVDAIQGNDNLVHWCSSYFLYTASLESINWDFETGFGYSPIKIDCTDTSNNKKCIEFQFKACNFVVLLSVQSHVYKNTLKCMIFFTSLW